MNIVTNTGRIIEEGTKLHNDLAFMPRIQADPEYDWDEVENFVVFNDKFTGISFTVYYNNYTGKIIRVVEDEQKPSDSVAQALGMHV